MSNAEKKAILLANKKDSLNNKFSEFIAKCRQTNNYTLKTIYKKAKPKKVKVKEVKIVLSRINIPEPFWTLNTKKKLHQQPRKKPNEWLTHNTQANNLCTTKETITHHAQAKKIPKLIISKLRIPNDLLNLNPNVLTRSKRIATINITHKNITRNNI